MAWSYIDEHGEVWIALYSFIMKIRTIIIKWKDSLLFFVVGSLCQVPSWSNRWYIDQIQRTFLKLNSHLHWTRRSYQFHAFLLSTNILDIRSIHEGLYRITCELFFSKKISVPSMKQINFSILEYCLVTITQCHSSSYNQYWKWQ